MKNGLPLNGLGMCTKIHFRCGEVRLIDRARGGRRDPADIFCACSSFFPSMGTTCHLGSGRRFHLSCKHAIGHPRFQRISSSMCCSFSLTDGMRNGCGLGPTCVSGLSFNCRLCPDDKRLVSISLFCGEFGGPVR